MDCRLCVVREAHVHVSDTRVALAQTPPDGFSFKPAQITGIDFALPAVKQNGQWWICTQELVELVWPRWKKKRLRLRPPEHENEPDQEQD